MLRETQASDGIQHSAAKGKKGPGLQLGKKTSSALVSNDGSSLVSSSFTIFPLFPPQNLCLHVTPLAYWTISRLGH